MKNNKNKNNYLISCVCSILILMTICYFGMNSMVKGTNAAFGNGCLTACMNANMLVIYSPNYPEGFESPAAEEVNTCAPHIISKNKFDVPKGYEFIGWNTEADGSGTTYYAFTCTILSSNITLYAQWKEKPIVYGDFNNDGNINEDDYLVLENHLNETSVLSDELLIAADVNGDSEIDEIDLDIIKQVYLGTEGYMGYLPSQIVPIYSLYEKTTDEQDKPSVDDENVDGDKPSEDDNEDVVTGSGSEGAASGNGTGTGGSGSGNSSSGNGGTSVKPSTGNNKPSENTSGNGSSNNDDVEDKEEVLEPVTYNFKFIVDDLEYSNTSCETVKGKTCKLVYPKDNPIKRGYKFNGWSMTKNCPSGVGINYSVLMESDMTYYACFLEVEDNNIYSVIIVGLIIIMVWGLSGFGIYYLIKRFKKTEIKD